MASFKNAAAAMLLALLISATTIEAAVTCSTVASTMTSCIAYLKGTVAMVPDKCCSGIKKLNMAASTTPDRQMACKCLKTAASTIKGINFGLAAKLPSNCGVNIPYKISPSTDCTLVK